MIGLPFLTSEDKPACMENPSLFYDDDYQPETVDGTQLTRAGIKSSQDAAVRRVCGDCPFRHPCAEWGIKRERHGWWGGLSPDQRADIRKAWGIVLDEPKHAVPGHDWVEGERLRKARMVERRLAEATERERASARGQYMNAVKYGRV
jgi:hypothetical protein